jgi:hypothetical protein
MGTPLCQLDSHRTGVVVAQSTAFTVEATR